MAVIIMHRMCAGQNAKQRREERECKRYPKMFNYSLGYNAKETGIFDWIGMILDKN